MSKPLLALGRNDNGTPLSHEEFAEAHFDEPWRYERVAGRLVVVNPAGHHHQDKNLAFLKPLMVYLDGHPDVVDFVYPEAWIVIDEQTDRIADIGVYLKSSRGQIPERIPEIVFEIVSEEGKDKVRDYGEKRVDYERIGVQEYVIVDRFSALVTVFRLNAGQYQSHALSATDSYSSPLLPGLEIPLTGIL
jgi:Uma2 family endonuclease